MFEGIEFILTMMDSKYMHVGDKKRLFYLNYFEKHFYSIMT